jgi:arylsulfatase A-like enzyme
MPKTMRWFAVHGTVFTEGYAVTPLCCPSRASIFTGRYAHNHGVLNNSSAWRLDHGSTLQRLLHGVGYRTAIAGKFLNGWNLAVDPPHFDRWAILEENIAGYYNVPFNVDGAVRRVRRYSTWFIRNQATDFLRFFERRDRRPWLLYVTPFAPHKPFTPAPKHASASLPPAQLSPAVHERKLGDKPHFIRDPEMAEPGARRTRARQLRTLMSVDDLVGRITGLLNRLGETDRTLAFFLSDHGLFWAEHGLVDKRLPYSEAVRIPFLVRWDGHIAAGVEDPRIVTTLDVAPTASAAAGKTAARRHRPDGRDIQSSSRDRVFLEYFVDPVRPVPAWSSIRTATLQYTEYRGRRGGVLFREFYDLSADPWQLMNLLRDGNEANDPTPAMLRDLSGMLSAGRWCRGIVGRRPCP